MKPSVPAVTLLAFVVACSGDSATSTSTTTGGPTTTPTTVIASTTTAAAPTTTMPMTTMPTTTTTASTTPTTAPATTVPPALGEPLVSLPVGADGIEYRGSGDEIETTGPSLFAVDPANGIHIVDPVGLRILSFTDGSQSSISLQPLDILGVTAIGAAQDHLLIVEVVFAPARQRVHRVGYDGTVRETIDLPPGFQLADGLSGVRAGPGGEIILEIRGGAGYGVWNDALGSFESFERLSIGGVGILADPPDLEIDGVPITADLIGTLGGLTYLGTAADGTHLVVREDVVSETPIFEVLSTVEWYSPDGELLGSARIPSLEEQFISTPPDVAMTADGRALALVARQDVVEVIELPRRPGRITEYSPPM